MNWRGRRSLILGVALALFACNACNDSAAAPKALHRFDPASRSATPLRPLIPSDLPAGWTMVHPQLRTGEGVAAPDNTQFLYMPAGSTPSSGPALVVGYVDDDQAPPSYCLAGTSDEKTTTDPPWLESNASYVFGREVSEADLQRAAGTVAWNNEGDAPSLKLPSGFSLRASSDLPAFGSPTRASLTVVRRHGASRGVFVGQARYNRAGVFVADFWRHVVPDPCRNVIQKTVVRGDIVVRLNAQDSEAGLRMVRTVRLHLRRGSRAEFCADGCGA